jgi:V/A-type H+-transporting ATPase subunit B
MKDGVGEGKTRVDHMEVSNQLYDAYARAQELRALAEIVGKGGLTSIDHKYLSYGDLFEQEFLKQNYNENRTLEETLDLAWKVLGVLPEQELTKIREVHCKNYYKSRSIGDVQ